MIRGDKILLRPVQEADLAQLYRFHVDIANRGHYFPLGVLAEPVFKQRFHDTGFWGKEEGMLLIVTPEGEIIGHVEYFPTVAYLDELELSYHLYDAAYRGQGIVTEAVNLLTGYLFANRKAYRIRLVIHPDNRASLRIAEKCGYRYEGTARGAWFHQGVNQDVAVYAQVRPDYYGDRRAD